jgi:sulfofructosephosphate aldolase
MQPLSVLARPSGAFSMVAMDQRESLRTIFREQTDERVDDSTLVDFKVAVARVLSPYASALLVDRPFGLQPTLDAGALDPACALIVADDRLVQQPGAPVDDTFLDEELDLAAVAATRAVALKLLVIWRDDDQVGRRLAMTRQFIAQARDAGLLSIVEAVVRPGTPDGREAAILDAAHRIGACEPDLYKAEVPLSGRGDPDAIDEAAQRITDAVPSPWVVLSSGVTAADFPSAVEAACRGGASGFLAGRAVWTDAIAAARGRDFDAALREISVPRLRQLTEIVDRVARSETR